jgi:hypothetical protein
MLHHQMELPVAIVLAHRLLLALSDHIGQWSALLYREAVARKVLYPEADGGIKVADQLGIGLGRHPEDDIDGQVVEARFISHANAPLSLFGIVCAVHPIQKMLVERLDSDAQAVDANAAP